MASNVNAGCDDPLGDGVDYTNCRFSEGQDLKGSYLPNSNLSFASFIQVNFDKSIMMNSNLSFGTFSETTFIRANLYEANLQGGNFEKSDFTSSNFIASSNSIILRIECNHTDSNDRTVFIDDIAMINTSSPSLPGSGSTGIVTVRQLLGVVGVPFSPTNVSGTSGNAERSCTVM